ncbi:TetR/AcrR family transcriptional regulator C-terminal domain-containing protein [Nonomuraea sp. NPDC046802]|uniref:TetR/AcrR family transcriptional regulator n=1 Tax=Nonomuraea sp. NPDC046802 TaxID=3154919 RepID=UPI0033F809B9
MARPSKTKLSPEIIVAAALEMTAETGEFTVPELARRLNVRPSSLYNHVSGRAEIIELIRRQMHEAMAVRVDVNADWPSVIRLVASAHRASLAEFPWLIPLLATSPATLDTSITTLENVATVLSKAGFGEHDVMMIIAMIDIIVIGASLDLVSPQDLYPAEVLAETTTFARVVRSAGIARMTRSKSSGLSGPADSSLLSGASETVDEAAGSDTSRADAAFAFTVDLVIDALRARLDRARRAR